MILVTGATGFVGAHLVLHLVENRDKVRAIYRTLESIEKTKSLFKMYKKIHLFEAIEWVQADIIDVPSLQNAFIGIDQVYHCAALISFDPNDEETIRKTNIEGTANVVNFCLAHQINKLGYISSIAALGDLAPQETIVTEETEWNPEKPHSDYAISKYGAEMELWRGQQEGLSILIVNPGVIIGPGFQEQGSGQLFKIVAQDLYFYTLGSTGFIAVSDVAKIMRMLMNSSICNERFTLVAQNISFRILLNTIAEAMQKQKPTRHAKPYIMEIIWRLDWIRALIFRKKRQFTRATAKASYSTTFYSNTKIKEALKIEFLDVTHYIKDISSIR